MEARDDEKHYIYNLISAYITITILSSVSLEEQK